jgi:hypothetical protein
MQKLCKIADATKILHAFSGVYSRVPPDLSRERNLDFRMPKQRSMTLRVLACAKLYACSDGVDGAATGVMSHGSNGYPESPAKHEHKKTNYFGVLVLDISLTDRNLINVSLVNSTHLEAIHLGCSHFRTGYAGCCSSI